MGLQTPSLERSSITNGASKILLTDHDTFLKRYVTTLVLENKIPKAINVVKNNLRGSSVDFFEAYLLLIVDGSILVYLGFE